MVGDLGDVITCAGFQIEIFMGYDFTGVEFSTFLLILAWALQQCSDTALPVINGKTWKFKHMFMAITHLKQQKW